MQAVKDEYEKQRQRDLKEMQQVYSKDVAQQLQTVYNQLEVTLSLALILGQYTHCWSDVYLLCDRRRRDLWLF